MAMFALAKLKLFLGYFDEKMRNNSNCILGDENAKFLHEPWETSEKFFSKASDETVKRAERVVLPFLVVSVVANIVFISFIGIYMHEALRTDKGNLLTTDIKCDRHILSYFTKENNSREVMRKENIARSTIDLLILVLSARERRNRDSNLYVRPTRENQVQRQGLGDSGVHSGVHVHSNDLYSTRTVEESGFYLTYSHVTLKSYDKGTKVQHGLNRKRQSNQSNTRTTVLMSQQNSMERDRMVFHTSTLVDVVYLQKDDVVYPSVDRMSSVYKMTHANYWGFTKLS